MKGYRDWQKQKRLREKEKNGRMQKGCNKQFPDCPEKPNKEDCRNCPFFK